MMLEEKIAFIGGGNMAEGIIHAMIKESVISSHNIHVFDIIKQRMDYLNKTYHIELITDLDKELSDFDILFIAVRPQDAEGVLRQIKESVVKSPLIISICAGITINDIEKELGETTKISRVMPNVLVEARHGFTGICVSPTVKEKDQSILKALFKALGQTIFIPESQFDAFTAFSCAGPAYLMYCISGLIDAGVQCGFSRNDSRNMVLENVIGSGLVLQETGEHPMQRVDKMTSPAGVTIDGVAILNKEGLTGILMEAVKSALDRTRDLS